MTKTPSTDLQEEARRWVNRFVERAALPGAIAVNLVFHTTWEHFCKAIPGSCRKAMYLERRAAEWVVHLCRQGLQEIWPLALQGWLEWELAASVLKYGPARAACNFRRRIMPLMPVTGAAENFIREIVDHIEKGLVSYYVTKMMMDWGHGLAQAHFLFFRSTQSDHEKEEYEHTLPHAWVRTHFLCQLLNDWLPVELLAKQGIGFAADLKTNWWRRYDFLLPEDRNLLWELAVLPERHGPDRYADTVVAMFSKVLPRLGRRERPPAVKRVLH